MPPLRRPGHDRRPAHHTRSSTAATAHGRTRRSDPLPTLTTVTLLSSAGDFQRATLRTCRAPSTRGISRYRRGHSRCPRRRPVNSPLSASSTMAGCGSPISHGTFGPPAVCPLYMASNPALPNRCSSFMFLPLTEMTLETPIPSDDSQNRYRHDQLRPPVPLPDIMS